MPVAQGARAPHSLEAWQDPKARPIVSIEGVTKAFGDHYAVDNVSLEVFQGEFFSLLGASGCGKTTLLRMLAGLETPDSGHIYIDGADMTHVPPYRRPVNMMFQSYALFPHMSVEQNIAFGLKQEGASKAQIKERVAEMLRLVRLEPYAKRRPHQLSGGQRQRVALARSLAKHPRLLLLDEPLGALDKKLREHTQFELVNIQEQLGTTFIMVTHDQEEAMTMSTRIAVMDEGRILQIGSPSTIYEYPATRYVADFIGSVNLFDGRVTGEHDGQVFVHCDEVGATMAIAHAEPLVAGTPVSVALRPEKMTVTDVKPESDVNVLRGVVSEIAYLGDVSIYYVALPNKTLVHVQLTNLARHTSSPLTWEQEVWLTWEPENGVVLQT
ncbi:putrescine transporter subunit: ATP-binding component of ABC superfamily [uncultured Alphaproteobacteria bacterium]|uniref:Spermidine/putrescine import ATP-binding protein PotA n=1 Tax=uncultured Alphaproteobacteria bacterium TaxID=91750 RepID=A0A212KMB3_9PROT|nr:putrescine transporter subunit: ATP-binding component of ABC superfamily [uncultured Alphaproteobacteria bacterium]